MYGIEQIFCVEQYQVKTPWEEQANIEDYN